MGSWQLFSSTDRSYLDVWALQSVKSHWVWAITSKQSAADLGLSGFLHGIRQVDKSDLDLENISSSLTWSLQPVVNGINGKFVISKPWQDVPTLIKVSFFSSNPVFVPMRNLSCVLRRPHQNIRAAYMAAFFNSPPTELIWNLSPLLFTYLCGERVRRRWRNQKYGGSRREMLRCTSITSQRREIVTYC